jgi:hypothetical protein
VSRWLALLIAVGTLVGCGTWRYEKAGLTYAELSRDDGECRRVAVDVSLVSIPTLAATEQVTVPEPRLDRDAYNRCMRDRGYTVRWE